jgi:hypothetical protein
MDVSRGSRIVLLGSTVCQIEAPGRVSADHLIVENHAETGLTSALA